jgi:Double-GTPase 2
MSFFSFLLHNWYFIAVQLGLLFGIVLFVWALVALWDKDAPLFTPADYRDEQLKAHPPGPDGIGPDLAWPLYTYRQASIDRALVRAAVKGLNMLMWKWPSATFFKGRNGPRWLWWTLLLEITAPVLVFLVTAYLISWACFWVYWAVIFAFQFVDKTVIASLRLQMRIREDRRRTAMYTDAACMNCLHVMPWPAYHCRNCHQPHNDVRPGDQGTRARKCQCGSIFPTLPSRAAWHTDAHCKRCGEQLPQGAGAARDIRVPIFGDTSAGKTRFLFASLNSLLLDTERAGIPLTFLDEDSRSDAEVGLGIIRDGRDMFKTSVDGAASVSLRLRDKRESDFIHLFDAAGERYSSPDHYDSLRFLEDGQALVYVLDPFSIDAIRDQLSGSSPGILAEARAAEHNADIAYGEVVNRLRGAGVPLRTQRLAVVVSKTDLLRTAGIVVPTESAAIGEWLATNGLHNLVMAARREFSEVTYFTVASQDAAASRVDDPGVPLCWLLAVHGVKLPGGPAALAASRPSKQPVEARP